MDGVTILQTIEVAQYGWGWSWAALLTITVGLLGLLSIIAGGIDGDPFFLCVGVVAFIFIGIFGTGSLCSKAKELPPTYQYQVLVEDNVNMNDFLEKYTVIEQQGITYIVEVKNER